MFVCFSSVLLQIPCLIIIHLVTNLIGLTVYAHYAAQGCDPLRDDTISNSNQVAYLVFHLIYMFQSERENSIHI